MAWPIVLPRLKFLEPARLDIEIKDRFGNPVTPREWYLVPLPVINDLINKIRSNENKDRKSDYGVSFPDFPGCITAGETLEEARRMAVEALTFHIEGITEDGEALPQPSSLDQLAKDRAMKGAVAFLVTVDVAEKSARFNITARRSQMDEIDRRAKRSGMTRSAYIVAAALTNMDRA